MHAKIRNSVFYADCTSSYVRKRVIARKKYTCKCKKQSTRTSEVKRFDKGDRYIIQTIQSSHPPPQKTKSIICNQNN